MPKTATLGEWSVDMTCKRGDKSTRSEEKIKVELPKQ